MTLSNFKILAHCVLSLTPLSHRVILYRGMALCNQCLRLTECTAQSRTVFQFESNFLTFLLDLQALRLYHFLHQSVPGLPLQTTLLLLLIPDLPQLLIDQHVRLLLLLLLPLQLLGQVLPVPLLVCTEVGLESANTQKDNRGDLTGSTLS